MRRCKSRHRKCWIMFGGRLAWCWECGAIRDLVMTGPAESAFAPDSRWTYPVGPDGENPALGTVVA